MQFQLDVGVPPHECLECLHLFAQLSITRVMRVIVNFSLLLNDDDDCAGEVDHDDETHDGVDDGDGVEVGHDVVVRKEGQGEDDNLAGDRQSDVDDPAQVELTTQEDGVEDARISEEDEDAEDGDSDVSVGALDDLQLVDDVDYCADEQQEAQQDHDLNE